MKRFLSFFLVLLLLGSLLFLPFPSVYYHLKLPFFTPTEHLFQIIFLFHLLGISLSVLELFRLQKDLSKEYWKSILEHCIVSIVLWYFFSTKHLFLSFLLCIMLFFTTLKLYSETANLEEKATKYLNFYTLWTLFLSILSLAIYVLNR